MSEGVTLPSNLVMSSNSIHRSSSNLSVSMLSPNSIHPSQSFTAEPQAELPASLINAGVIDLAKKLQEYIQQGDIGSAKLVTDRLTKLTTALEIKPHIEQTEAVVSVQVNFEDIECSQGHCVLNLPLTLTIKELKDKLLLEYGFPPEVQVWIIKQRIVKDDESLKSLGLSQGDVTALPQLYVYLWSRDKVGLTQQLFNKKYGRLFNRVCDGDVSGFDLFEEEEVTYPVTESLSNGAVSTASPEEVSEQVPVVTTTTDDQELGELAAKLKGWACVKCTYQNVPTRPGCEVCGADRPNDYVVPDDVPLSENERLRIQQEGVQADRLRQLEMDEEEANTRARNAARDALVEVADVDLIPNTEVFECAICFLDVETGDGAILRECLHMFCKECLSMHIKTSEESAVQCPYSVDYTCNNIIQEREVKQLISSADFVKYLQRGLSQAEGAMHNTFHCKTADCRGWCQYEDEVNFFPCPVCKKRNCLTCRAIHDGMNCKQYQDDLKIQAENDVAAKQSNDAIQAMLTDGVAMQCTSCAVILQKKDGCDWIRCTMCKTEICWVTKQNRWGPAGNGDTSAGCRCGVDGKLCHPKCANCH